MTVTFLFFRNYLKNKNVTNVIFNHYTCILFSDGLPNASLRTTMNTEINKAKMLGGRRPIRDLKPFLTSI